MDTDHRPNECTDSGTEENGADYYARITLRDRKHNTWIRQQTGETDITDNINKLKHRWKGHVARLQDNRLTNHSNGLVTPRMNETKRETKSEMERQPCLPLGSAWPRLARDRYR